MSVRIVDLVGGRAVRLICGALVALIVVLVPVVAADGATYSSGAGELSFYRFSGVSDQ
jgi:hypothetical protein